MSVQAKERWRWTHTLKRPLLDGRQAGRPARIAPARRTPALALALVWRGLPADRPLAEREVNDALTAQLAGAAGFLDTDHVELRRWLVDAGWLARDGFGREYRRVQPRALQAASRALASAIALIEPERWCAEQRAAKANERATRREAWLVRQRACR